eukprot:7846567-Alexandrium_andersonii.AAC.1
MATTSACRTQMPARTGGGVADVVPQVLVGALQLDLLRQPLEPRALPGVHEAELVLARPDDLAEEVAAEGPVPLV